MIKQVTIQNFKSLKDILLDLSPITIIIGPNSSGKSSVFQALLSLKRLIASNLKINYNDVFNIPNYINLGEITDIAHEKKYFPIVIKLKLKNKDDIIEYAMKFYKDNRIDIALKIEDNEMLFESKRDIILPYSSPKPTTEALTVKNNNKKFSIRWNGLFHFDFPDPQPPENIKNNFLQSVSELKNVMFGIYLIPYFKLGFAQPKYVLSQSTNISNQLIIPETHVIQKLQENADVDDYIYGTTEELFNKPVKYHPYSNGVELYVRYKRGKTFKLVGEGGGLNRIVYMLGAILSVPEDSYLLLEEPETNLHPAAQYKLAKYFVELSKDFNRQLIITTHSEHLLNGFLNCIRTQKLNRDDITIYYFNKDGIKTEYRKLEIDTNGRVKGGLPGFFEERIAELIRLLGGSNHGKEGSGD